MSAFESFFHFFSNNEKENNKDKTTKPDSLDFQSPKTREEKERLRAFQSSETRAKNQKEAEHEQQDNSEEQSQTQEIINKARKGLPETPAEKTIREARERKPTGEANEIIQNARNRNASSRNEERPSENAEETKE